MVSQRRTLNKELKVLDKRADSVTIELIIAQQELDCMQERKSQLEKDIGELKCELVNYLKGVKPQPQPQSSCEEELEKSVRGQRELLRALNEEIKVRKSEIDELRERSVGYLKQFRSEIGQNERELGKLKSEKMAMVNELSQLGHDIEEVKGGKNKLLAESKYETDKIEANRKSLLRQHDHELKKLNDLVSSLEDRRLELDKYEGELEKRRESFERLKSKESDLIKTIENLNVDLHKSRSKLEELKKQAESEKLTKRDLKDRIETLNSELMHLNEQFEQRKHEYVSLDEQLTQRQMMAEQENEARQEFEYERVQLVSELEQLADKCKVKQCELDKLEEAVKVAEIKLQQLEADCNSVNERLVKSELELETREQKLNEHQLLLNDSGNKIKLKQQYLEELGGRIKKKEEEVDYLDTCLQQIKSECQS